MRLRSLAKPIYEKWTTKVKTKRHRVTFGVNQVVGNGGSKDLPTFASRLYSEAKSIREFLNGLYVERSLEVGCGYGRLTPWVAEHSNECYAIEPEKELYEIAKRLYPSIHFKNAPAEKLPFPKKHFGLIVSWTVLQHIPPEKFQSAIKEIVRVATDDASILMAEYTRFTPSPSTWGHWLEEYSWLLKPFELVKHEPRKVEPLVSDYVGEIMMFRKPE